eukprot:EG_transcript_31513
MALKFWVQLAGPQETTPEEPVHKYNAHSQNRQCSKDDSTEPPQLVSMCVLLCRLAIVALFFCVDFQALSQPDQFGVSCQSRSHIWHSLCLPPQMTLPKPHVLDSEEQCLLSLFCSSVPSMLPKILTAGHLTSLHPKFQGQAAQP